MDCAFKMQIEEYSDSRGGGLGSLRLEPGDPGDEKVFGRVSEVSMSGDSMLGFDELLITSAG